MDWMTVVVRFALYVDLMLVFGLPLFQVHAMRKPERSSALAGKPSQHTSAERVEVRLEFSGVHHAALDELGSVVPERAREVGKAVA